MNKAALITVLSISDGEAINGDLMIEDSGGIRVISGSGGELLSIGDVEVLLKSCQSHLENLTAIDILKINRGRRKHDREDDKRFRARVEQQKPAKSADGYVYLMLNKRNGLTKIGYSVMPKTREATLQSQEPEIEILHKWPGSLSSERELHNQFRAQRIRGEWFRLDEVDISLIEGRMTRTGGF